MRVVPDTSVWIDHLRRTDPELVRLLATDSVRVLSHAAVIGELACGSLRNREAFLRELRSLPVVAEASTVESLQFLELHRLLGRGLGWVDVQLLAACRMEGARLWTRDRRLAEVASDLGIGYPK